jgi:hypothetical protein
MKSLESATREYARKCVSELALEYGFSEEEALKKLNLENLKLQVQEMKKRSGGKAKSKELKVKETKVKKVEKALFPLPFSHSNVLETGCQGLAYNGGLFTQCPKVCMTSLRYCKGCQSEIDKNGLTTNGTVAQRLACEVMEFKDPKGRKPVAYVKIMEKQKLSREQVEAEAGKLNILIDEKHFVVEEKKEKKEKKKIEKEEKEDDLLAQLLDNLEIGDEDEEAVDVDSVKFAEVEEKKAKEAEVAVKKQQQAEEKAAKEAEVALKKQQQAEEKAAKDAEVALKKQQQAEEKAAKEAEVALKKQQQAEEKAAKEKKIADEKAAKEKKIADEKAEKAQKIAEEKAAKEQKIAEEKALKKQQQEDEKALKKQQQEEEKALKKVTSPEKKQKETEAKEKKQKETEPKEKKQKEAGSEIADEKSEAPAPKKVTVKRITIEGKQYLKTADNLLYNPETKEEMGIYDPVTNTIKDLPDDEEDELSEDDMSDDE